MILFCTLGSRKLFCDCLNILSNNVVMKEKKKFYEKEI